MKLENLLISYRMQKSLLGVKSFFFGLAVARNVWLLLLFTLENHELKQRMSEN